MCVCVRLKRSSLEVGPLSHSLIPLSNFQNRLIIVTIVDTRKHSPTSNNIDFKVLWYYFVLQQHERISYRKQSWTHKIFLRVTKCSAHASRTRAKNFLPADQVGWSCQPWRQEPGHSLGQTHRRIKNWTLWLVGWLGDPVQWTLSSSSWCWWNWRNHHHGLASMFNAYYG